MKRINLIVLLIVVNCQLATVNCFAQPQKSRVQNNRTTAARNAAAVGTDRASLMFPTAVDVPEDPSWRRDIYRSIDLTKDENAALYYPVEPQGGQMNLFTLLFKLLNTGKIPAYEYQLDGIENFQQSNRMHFKDLLDRQKILYEVDGNSIKVEQADIPSADVLSYYVKESSYYDQNTATYHSRIVALCPVLHKAADEYYVRETVSEDDDDQSSLNIQKFPLFWVKYDDIKTYLSGQELMTSNLNNAAKMSMDDFFSTNHYKGEIYMTTNMQNRSLQQYCATDSLLKKEQGRIEKEMSDFEAHIWSTPVDSVELARRDSIAAASAKGKKNKSGNSSSAARTSRRSSSASSGKEKSSGSSRGSSGAPRVSVRRQRH
jgi:gliding motility associated protien GldN